MGWGIIGTGRISQSMTKAIAAANGARAVAVVSRSMERAGEFAAEHEIPGAFASLDAMLEDDDVDVVYIASPNALHREQAVASAAAGRHVFCEKPMAPDVESSRKIVTACSENGVQLGVALQYRQHLAHQKMREIVASGALGAPVFADAAVHVPHLASTPDWYGDPEVSGGGGILPMSGVHRIDLLRFILGSEVVAVSAFVDQRDPGQAFEDVVAALLRFQDGTAATLRFGFGISQGGDTVSVHGSDASLVGVRTMSQWWGGGGGQVRMNASGFTSTYEFEASDLYAKQVEAFNRSLDSGMRPGAEVATGLDGLRAAEITAAIYRASRTGQTVSLDMSR